MPASVYRDAAWRELHILRTARDRYGFDETLFATNGTVIFANFYAAKVFAQRMNEKRDLIRFPEEAVRASQINAMGMIDEFLHIVIARYRDQQNPTIMKDALAWLGSKLDEGTVDTVLQRFTEAFPPVSVYRQSCTAEEYLNGTTDGIPHRQIVLEELLILWLENTNPAFMPYLELFDDAELEQKTPYLLFTETLVSFFKDQPSPGQEDQNLLDMLRSPALTAPHSLSEQLEYIRTRWGGAPDGHFYRLLSSLDFIAEEEKPVFFGPGPSQVPDYETLFTDVEEPERYSADLSWMPNVMLMAKNAYVWLDQLSRTHQRAITRLDQIPDEELDTLARRGFTALWLIGLWERSTASQHIKQMCGNPEAAASAYSLAEYDIAQDLGGPEALVNLKERANARDIRLASDMVPNHMGIDARWVIEHPDWFISLDHSPYPAYSFTGPDFSKDERVGIFLEDHYFDRTDAAVVFKRVDFQTGDERYIYHGNDGTHMPWNDTAQLNFMNPEVREAVIQTILHVARQFQIIRFDAAMTLTKRHYQRLWFPEPGTGGDIPSRADHSLSRRDFDTAMPDEFWRELVDRVAQEAPNTLLLAEAFWLMEGYFVRTLGMHRVYNSAYMNMLRDEDNAGYRQVMKNTMGFDPEILKRFVNFMNNPDEDTAVDQFGKGDKYFGVCAMMVTLPGLPMFGHGQIEGFIEKYGMEYRRAYRDEAPDQDLIARHEREIMPLIHRRYLFAEVTHFYLYDFQETNGSINEDVFAYSNQRDDERALVIYHNAFGDTRGWIRQSVGFAIKESGGNKRIEQRSLGEGLSLHPDDSYFTIFREYITGQEYIRRNRELCEQGLYVELDAYRYYVYLDFREVTDDQSHRYAHLTDYLSGRGVPDIEAAMQEVLLQPVHRAFGDLVNAANFRRWGHACVTPGGKPDETLLDDVEECARTLVDTIGAFSGETTDGVIVAHDIRERMTTILRLSILSDNKPGRYMQTRLHKDSSLWYTLSGWVCVHVLGKSADDVDYADQSRSRLDEWHFGRILSGVLQDLGTDEQAADYQVAIIKVLTAHQRWFEQTSVDRPYDLLSMLLRDPDVHRVLQVNRHQGILWYNMEAFDELLWWLFVISVVICHTEAEEHAEEKVLDYYTTVQTLQQASTDAEYRVEKLLETVQALQD